MKSLFFLLLSLAPFTAAAQNVDCYSMDDTAKIQECLNQQEVDAEKRLDATYNTLMEKMKQQSAERAAALRTYELSWIKSRDLKCKYALSSSDGGDQKGLGEIQCRINESIKQQIELEQISTAENKNLFLFEHEKQVCTIECRKNVSEKVVNDPWFVEVQNGEMNRAMEDVQKLPDVVGKKLRIKSIKTVTDNDQVACKGASVFLVELGYYAVQTVKYIKIYVRSDVTADHKVTAIRSFILENIDNGEVKCP